MTKKKIHFVCRANIYRSRLAEGYFKSLTGDEYDVSSSGIQRWRYPSLYFKDGWTKMLAKQHNFELSPKSAQTTDAILAEQDLVIFARQDVYDDAVRKYHFDKSKCIVWDIKDRDNYSSSTKRSVRREETWKSIDHSVKQLIKMLDNPEDYIS